jgi:very-short-patch-repair endonuclease
MCKELKLVIEVDGITHTFEQVIENDKIRQTKLEEYGFTVIRFTDNDVLTNIESVRRSILITLENLKATNGANRY